MIDLKTLETDDIQEIVWDEDPRFERIEETIVETSRWSIWMQLIVREEDTDNYWAICYDVPATEMQECEFEPQIRQVEPYQKTITDYRDV